MQAALAIDNVVSLNAQTLKSQDKIMPANYQNDPIVQYGMELGRQYKIFAESDERAAELRKSGNQKEADKCDVANTNAADLLNSLDHVISHYRASSLEGAAVQLMVLYDCIDMCANGTEEAQERYAKMAERLAYSIKSVLQEHIAINLDELGAQRHMPENLNPWNKSMNISKQADPVVRLRNEFQEAFKEDREIGDCDDSMLQQLLEECHKPLGEAFFAFIDKAAYKAQLVLCNYSKTKVLRISGAGSDQEEWLMMDEKQFLPIIERFGHCKAYASLWEDVSLWDAPECVEKHIAECSAHPAFSKPMDLKSVNQRRGDLRISVSAMESNTDEDDDIFYDEVDALEWRLALSIPQTIDDAKAVLSFLQTHTIRQNAADGEIYGYEVQQLNIIKNILSFLENMQPVSAKS